MTLQFGQVGLNAETFQLSGISERPFEEVLASLRRQIEQVGMKVLHEIDPQGALKSMGQMIGGSRLVFFFHPNLLIQLFQANWSAVVEAPLKLAVMELPEGMVSVRIADPAKAFARYGTPALTTFGQELAATCEQIIAGST